MIQNGKVKVDQTIVNINSMKKRVGTNRGGVECEQKFFLKNPQKFINSPQKNKIFKFKSHDIDFNTHFSRISLFN